MVDCKILKSIWFYLGVLLLGASCYTDFMLHVLDAIINILESISDMGLFLAIVLGLLPMLRNWWNDRRQNQLGRDAGRAAAEAAAL